MTLYAGTTFGRIVAYITEEEKIVVQYRVRNAYYLQILERPASHRYRVGRMVRIRYRPSYPWQAQVDFLNAEPKKREIIIAHG